MFEIERFPIPQKTLTTEEEIITKYNLAEYMRLRAIQYDQAGDTQAAVWAAEVYDVSRDEIREKFTQLDVGTQAMLAANSHHKNDSKISN